VTAVAVDPTGNDLKTFLAEDPGGPVVMLNLLRFKADGGRESYEQYSRALVEQGHLARVGGELLYAGDGSTALVAEDGQAWDAVLVVRYPSRAAFCQMVADADYQKVTHFRTEALEEAVLQATTPWGSR
jgi:uncharacterized protein (DUF1330 family)